MNQVFSSRGRAVVLLVMMVLAFSAEAVFAADDPLGIPPKVKDKLQVFFERFSRAAPGRKIQIEPEWRQPPSGFLIFRRRLTSTEDKFNENIPILLSQDHSTVFSGQAIRIETGGERVVGPEGSSIVSKYLTEKAGAPIEVILSSKRGPAGTILGKMIQATEIGRIETDCSVSSDGFWFLAGGFYDLESDPRKERVKRLKLDGCPATGSAKGAVTIVEFSDFQCPSCRERQSDIDGVVEKYKGKVRLVHVDHPIWKIHDWAVAAAEGSRCAERLGGNDAYWKYKKLVYERQKDINAANFDDLVRPIVESIGVDVSAWNTCRKEHRMLDVVRRDVELGHSLGVQSTPTLLVNGTLIDYGIDKVLDKVVRDALAGK